MSKNPQILTTSIVAQTSMFTIESVHLCFSNGQQRIYERTRSKGHGAVMIVPMLDSKTILLIREYAVGVDDYVLGFPKGGLSQGEPALVAANRELMEEVGYRAGKLTPFARLSAAPGYTMSMMEVVLAQDLTPASAEGDEPEPIEVVSWSIDKIDELLAQPEFHEGRSQAALLLLERKLRHAS